MKEHEVYEWIREDELDPKEKVIDARFNDLRKASGLLRSRCIGREYAEEAGGGKFFAGTPPLALTKFVLSRAASRGLEHKSRCVGLHDIEVAFFHVYLEKPMPCHCAR